MRTFIWELRTVSGQSLGYFPANPWEAVISYSVLGEELLVAPQWFSGVDTLEGMIELSWPDTLTNETAWHIDRRVPPGDWVNDYALLPTDSSYFADSNLWGSAQHQYRVRPSNAHQSPTTTSELHTATTRPNTPRNVQATVIMRRYDEYTPTAVGASTDGADANTERNGDRASTSSPRQHDVIAADAGGGGGPIWRATNAVRVSFDAPDNQAVPPTSYIVRAWPEGVYCNNGPSDPCPLPPEGASTINTPAHAYEWYEVSSPGIHDICLGKKNWQYEVGVFARGYDGQWSLISPLAWISTGPDSYHDCQGGYSPEPSAVTHLSGSAVTDLQQNIRILSTPQR